MVDDWKPGDLALCVNDTAKAVFGYCKPRRGRIYIVEAIGDERWDSLFERSLGLYLKGTGSIEDAETIRLLAGNPAKVSA